MAKKIKKNIFCLWTNPTESAIFLVLRIAISVCDADNAATEPQTEKLHLLPREAYVAKVQEARRLRAENQRLQRLVTKLLDEQAKLKARQEKLEFLLAVLKADPSGDPQIPASGMTFPPKRISQLHELTAKLDRTLADLADSLMARQPQQTESMTELGLLRLARDYVADLQSMCHEQRKPQRQSLTILGVDQELGVVILAGGELDGVNLFSLWTVEGNDPPNERVLKVLYCRSHVSAAVVVKGKQSGIVPGQTVRQRFRLEKK